MRQRLSEPPDLSAVFIAEVHFNTGDMLTEAVQAGVDLGRNTGGQFFPALYVFVGVDLNLHDQLPFYDRRPARRCRKGGGRLWLFDLGQYAKAIDRPAVDRTIALLGLRHSSPHPQSGRITVVAVLATQR